MDYSPGRYAVIGAGIYRGRIGPYINKKILRETTHTIGVEGAKRWYKDRVVATVKTAAEAYALANKLNEIEDAGLAKIKAARAEMNEALQAAIDDADGPKSA